MIKKSVSFTRLLGACVLLVALASCEGVGSDPDFLTDIEDDIEVDGDIDTDEDFEASTDEDMDVDEDSDENSATGMPTDHLHGQVSQHHHCTAAPAFVDTALMSISAVQSGAWSDMTTWGGTLPVDGSRVHIPEGLTVTVDDSLAARHETVRIDGTLDFAADRNTRLQVDTLFTSCSGSLQIGSALQPIQNNVTAQVVFIDDGPVSDEQRLSRGAILMGKTTVHGAARTHRAIITPQATQGDSVLKLNIIPTDWQINDQIIITGTVPGNPQSDEVRQVAALDGSQVTLDQPLMLDHTAPAPDLNVYVANTTRNVEFVSESETVAHRGHIMLMSLDVNIQNARFTRLGRTDKTIELNDFQFDFHDGGDGDDAPASADLVALGGSNVRGRYPVHFHRAGTSPGSTPALVKGSVVFDGPGWGFVNHSSNVDFIDNVSYDLQGAGFYTEAGDETGTMQGNIAIRSVNRSFYIEEPGGAIDPDLRAYLMDYGHDGDGYWLTGNRVRLIDNVAAGASAHGFVYWTDGIMEPDASPATRATVAVSDLPNGNLIPGRQSVPVWWAPLAEIRNNESYGATVGFRMRYVHAKNYLGRDEQSDFHRSPPAAYIETLQPAVNDLTVWGNRDGVLLNYNERMTLNGARIVGFGKDVSQFNFNPGTAKSGIGLDIGNDATHGPGRVSEVQIEGFGMGMAIPVNGQWDLQNLTLRNNSVDLLVQPTDNDQTQVILQSVTFDTFEVYDEAVDQLPEHVVVVN